MKLFFLVLFFTLSVFAAPETNSGTENSVDDLEKRINDLEQRQKEMNEWSSNFYIQGKEGVFFYSIVAQGYLEHYFSDYFIVQSGLGYIPFGVTYQQRESELFRLRTGSQMIAYEDGDTVGISTPLWMGLQIYGLIPANEHLGYNLYTFTPVSKQNTLGVGGRLWYKVIEKAKVGTSVQSGQQNKGNYFSHGFDLDIHYDQYGFISEYGYGNFSESYLDSEFYYFEPYVKFTKDEWLFFLNAEFVNTPERTDVTTRIPDPVKSWQYGGGFNWLPIPNARLRLTYLFHDYLAETDTLKGQERDYHTIDFSTAVAF